MNIVETLIKLIINNAFIFVIIGGIIFNVVQRFMAQSKEEEQQRSKKSSYASCKQSFKAGKT